MAGAMIGARSGILEFKKVRDTFPQKTVEGAAFNKRAPVVIRDGTSGSTGFEIGTAWLA
jgi:hypothetical protein